MIVTDTNVIAYFILAGPHGAAAEAAFRRDPEWAVPVLWRSEFRNVLAVYLRTGTIALSKALETMARAEKMLCEREHTVSSEEVLRLAARSSCTAYDCEFVALAERLGVPLVTADAELVSRFPETAVSLTDFANGC